MWLAEEYRQRYIGRMALKDVQAAYAQRAPEYVAQLGTLEQMADADRACIAAWVRGVSGPIVDVGCGPGHWTDFIRQQDAEIVGIDPVAEFVALAQRRFPLTEYRAGDASALGVTDGSLGGILAWYSLIHLAADELRGALAAFRQALAPGGSLLIGYFDGAAGEPFDHAVTTAYFWSVDALTGLLEAAGFRVVDAVTRHDPGARPHGAIVAL